MPRLATILVFVVLTSGSTATAQDYLSLPPVEYDKPNTNMKAFALDTLEEIWEICGRGKPMRRDVDVYGCSYPNSNPCWVVYLKGFGRVRRHEQGHCNGWSKTHEGARF